MTFFYKELDFPSVPQELIDQVSISLVNVNEDSGYGHQHHINGNKVTACGYEFGRVENLEIVNWMKDNIPTIKQHLENPKVMHKRIFAQAQKFKGTSGYNAHIVHSDYKRIAVLNYHWARGGDTVTTRWYKEKDKPLWKNKQRQGGHQSDDREPVEYENLEILAEVETKPHRWYLINTCILHDVQNLTSDRKGFTVCFLDEKELEYAGFEDYPKRPPRAPMRNLW